jgi:hypothetical protein
MMSIPCAPVVIRKAVRKDAREIHEKTVDAVPIGFFEDDGRTPVTEETQVGGATCGGLF